MASSQDTEITLGTGKLLGVFFSLVAICAAFFALGYTLGRRSDSGLSGALNLASLPATSGAKPASSGAAASAPMTFYKAVEQQNANPQLTPAAAVAGNTDAASPASGQATPPAPGASSAGEQPQAQAANPPDPMAAIPTTGYYVQVAAVTKQEDAEALVDALKKKQYPAFVANNAVDKLFRVQVGPYGDIKEAEAMRSRLINDGYNPILKK
ncbi:MAG: SPOR domain-containing protein [Candidatus Sulfotelmatobacter sp.]